jgi:CPA2 family monovalent cation:H+ antiporter-2
MEIPLFKDILIIFGLAIIVIFICSRVYIPPTVGFLITGILGSPHGLGLVRSVGEVEILAEIGVVLLLFTIGIEFSMENLLRVRRSVLIGGTAQVFITILVTFIIAFKSGLSLSQSLFAGFLVSLSSTAIVLKILQDRAEIESPQGRTTLAILIYQDIIVVPMMILIPLLSSRASSGIGPAILSLLQGIGVIALVILSARWIVPKLLFLIARTRSKELFLLSIIFICFSVAFLTYHVGLSLALGAFLAGLIISETEFSHETLGSIIPFKDIFTSIFFVSIGMLLDIDFLFHHPLQVLSMTLAVVIVKGLLALFSVLLLGLPLRVAILVGLSLCQVGEFSFILFMKGVDLGLLQGDYYQLFLNIAVITMGLTPLMISLSSRLANAAVKIPFPNRLLTGLRPEMMSEKSPEGLHKKDHLIIVGFGLNGKNLAGTTKAAGIPYVIIEMNPETVLEERKKGEPIFYGDSTREEVLKSAGLARSRILVIVIADPAATRRIVSTARKMNPKIYIIARTRFVSEMEGLHRVGADEVIPEEFETSIEIFSRVLAKYLIPRNEIEQLISGVRMDGYHMLRTGKKGPDAFTDLKQHLPGIEIGTFRVHSEGSATGKSLKELQLRSLYEVTLLAVQRNGQTISNPKSETRILAGDILVFMGRPDVLAGLCGLFHNQKEGGEPESCSFN